MKGAILLFGAIGGLGVPVVFLLAAGVLRGFAPDSAVSLALLHGLQLPLWPMSKLILDDPSGKHWLYLPLAAVLSNALLYAIVGAASAWGRTNRGVYFALPVAVVGLQAIAAHGFGSDVIGYLLAAMFSVAGLVLYHRGYVR
jgi:hypothetical protein